MAIIKCQRNHYYDDTKFSSCPHCERIDNGGGIVTDLENKTVAKPLTGDSLGENLTKSLRDSISNSNDSQRTIGFMLDGKNLNPVAGWLVCTAGENRGRSFEVHIGKNFVGRSMKMDIHSNDEQISRENHFSIIYDPKSLKFFALQGKGITYYNGKILSDGVELSEGDKLKAGKSEYVFVPFCREGRDWSD